MITTLSYTGLMNGNMMLIDAVKDLPQDLQECTKASQDLEALEKWAATYLTPVDLIQTMEYNVNHSLGKLSLSMAKAKRFHAGDNWYQLGETLGEMLVILTQPEAVMFLN